MAPTSTPQDDYYSQMQAAQKSGADDKKPVKLKLKAVVKKSHEEEGKEMNIETPPVPVEDGTIVAMPTPSEKTIVEKPKARLIEREHAGEGLLRSVMRKDPKEESKDTGEKKGFPKISFSRADSKVKVLENRPVMELPESERYPPRRSSNPPARNGSSSNSNALRPRPSTSSTPSSTPS